MPVPCILWKKIFQDRRVVITYEGLSEFGVTNSASSFQVRFFLLNQQRGAGGRAVFWGENSRIFGK